MLAGVAERVADIDIARAQRAKERAEAALAFDNRRGGLRNQLACRNE